MGEDSNRQLILSAIHKAVLQPDFYLDIPGDLCVDLGLLSRKVLETLTDEVAAQEHSDLDWDPNREIIGKAIEQGFLPEDFYFHIPLQLLVELNFCNKQDVEERSRNTASKSVSVGTESIHHPSTLEIGRYRNLELLGEGAMGKVYKALDPLLNRFVALKILHRYDDGELRTRLLREARAQARIEHQNVAKVHEVGEVNGQIYIAMQFIQGKTLTALQRQLSFEQKIRIMQDVANGIHAAHRTGVIHRDIKPGNIMLEPSEDVQWKAYVTDFGIAHESEAPELTRTGQIIGSPLYMAPEQARGDSEKVDRRTDVYAIGVTLYEIIVGKPPFNDKSCSVILRRIEEDDPIAPRKTDKNIPRDVENIILRCLEKQPDKRYESAKALAQDLTRYLDGEPVTARQASKIYRLTKKVKKYKASVTLGFVAILSILVLGSISIKTRMTARSQAQLAQSFGEAINRIESVLRFAYTSPLHDVKKEKLLVASEMQNIKLTMKKMGSVAKGPGHYALGRGYIALRQYDKAQENLQEAWNNNYREPQVARALGFVLGKFYQESLVSADRIHDKEIADARKKEITRVYLVPALQYLKTFDASQPEDQYYYQGLIFLYEKNYDEAFNAAKKAHSRKPYFYETKRLQGDILLGRARDYRAQGNYIAASASLSVAQKQYADAVEYGRSDPEVHGSLCAMWNEVLRIAEEQGRNCKEPFTLAKASCDKGILADNENEYLFNERAWSSYLYGMCIVNRGENPENILLETINDTERALVFGKDAVAFNLLAQTFVALGEYKQDHGQDPRKIYERAIESSKHALEVEPHNAEAHLNSANASWRNGLYVAERGEDPMPWFSRSVLNYETVLKDVKNIRISINKGNVYQMMGIHAYDYGQDPTTFLQKSISSYDDASNSNPRQSLSYSNSSASYFYLGLYKASRGQSPLENFNGAIAACKEALRNNPSDDFALTMIGIIKAHSASYSLKNGVDPRMDIAESIMAFRKSLQINPDSAVVLQNMSLPYLTKAEYELEHDSNPSQSIQESVRLLGRAEQIIPDDFWTHVLWGRTDLLRGIWEERTGKNPHKAWAQGLSKANKALEINPNSLDACLAAAELNLTIAEWLAGKKLKPQDALKAARKALNRASSINAADSEVYRFYAQIHNLEANAVTQNEIVALAVENGLSMAERSLSINPNNVEAFALKAILLKNESNAPKKESLDKATQLLKAAFQRKPSLKRKYRQYL